MGRELVQRAFSGQSLGSSSPSPSHAAHSRSPPPPPQPPRKPVFVSRDVDLEALLEDFYSHVAPEKIPDIPKVLDHFLTRDKHAGLLLATLEDKYKVRFQPNGTYEML
jgi:hypothetical protein